MKHVTITLGSISSTAILNGTNVLHVVISVLIHFGTTIGHGGIGVAYKPCLVRGRNHYGNLRIGASGGSDTDKFIAGIHAGYEHNLSLRHGWGLYIQAKCDLIVPDRKDLFRTGIVIGFKIPTSKR